ncbi:hypothetical protein DSECCO2_471480 [anaerobic digester metagenome]
MHFHREGLPGFPGKGGFIRAAAEEMELVFGPGHGNIVQPAGFLIFPDFLFRISIRKRFGRKNSVKHIQQIDLIVLKSLARMNGGQNEGS